MLHISKKGLVWLLPVVVLVNLFFTVPSWSKMMMWSYATLLKKADLIVIAKVVKVQALGKEEKNTLKVEEVLKGEWPLPKVITIVTSTAKREDKLRFGEPGFRAVLFLSLDEKGKPYVIHSIQGVWPLDGKTPVGYGLGKSLEQLREDIKLGDALKEKEKEEMKKSIIKWGYITPDGKMVIQPQFLHAERFSEGLAAIRFVDGKDGGFIDETGKLIIKLEPGTYASNFSEGLAKITVDNKDGFIDKQGKQIIPPRLESAGNFSEGLAKAKGGMAGIYTGFVDRTGKMVIEPRFTTAESFSEGLALASEGGSKYGYLDKTGTMVISPKFQYSNDSAFHEGLAAVSLGEKWGFIDKTGKTAIEPHYEGAGRFSQGLAPVRTGGKWGYIDRTGKMSIKPQFEEAAPFAADRAAVCLGRLWGFVDTTGALVIKPQFSAAGPFSEGLARVEVKEGDKFKFKTGYIDKDGKMKIPLQFEQGSDFSGGLAPVGIISK